MLGVSYIFCISAMYLLSLTAGKRHHRSSHQAHNIAATVYKYFQLLRCGVLVVNGRR